MSGLYLCWLNYNPESCCIRTDANCSEVNSKCIIHHGNSWKGGKSGNLKHNNGPLVITLHNIFEAIIILLLTVLFPELENKENSKTLSLMFNLLYTNSSMGLTQTKLLTLVAKKQCHCYRGLHSTLTRKTSELPIIREISNCFRQNDHLDPTWTSRFKSI